MSEVVLKKCDRCGKFMKHLGVLEMALGIRYAQYFCIPCNMYYNEVIK